MPTASTSAPKTPSSVTLRKKNLSNITTYKTPAPFTYIVAYDDTACMIPYWLNWNLTDTELSRPNHQAQRMDAHTWPTRTFECWSSLFATNLLVQCYEASSRRSAVTSSLIPSHRKRTLTCNRASLVFGVFLQNQHLARKWVM